MFYGLRPLREAATQLDPDPNKLTSRTRLGEAFRLIWEASSYRAFWPPDLQSNLDDLLDLVHRYGSIDRTSSLLNDDEVREAEDRIRSFTSLAEEVDRSLH